MAITTDEKSLSYLETSGQALASAQKLAQSVDAEKSAAAVLSPGLTNSMLSAGLLEEHDKSAAMEKMATHDGSLELLGNLLSYLGNQKEAYQKKLAAVDRGVSIDDSEKSASATPTKKLNPNYLGQRTGIKKASDRIFLEGLGLA